MFECPIVQFGFYNSEFKFYSFLGKSVGANNGLEMSYWLNKIENEIEMGFFNFRILFVNLNF